MGQASNSHRNASLDNKKVRAAGRARRNDPATSAIREGIDPLEAEHEVGGAFGRDHDGDGQVEEPAEEVEPPNPHPPRLQGDTGKGNVNPSEARQAGKS